MSTIADALPGARVLDLFSGSGALGLEALSRGASHATFVDDAPGALRVLNANIAVLGAASRVTVTRADALRYLDRLEERAFEVALADPPYGAGLAAAIAQRFLARPFASLLCVEHRRDEPLPGVEAALERRYGDTLVTYIQAAA